MLLSGGLAIFEGSKGVEFCHSCHSIMDLYVVDMLDSKSETLAAAHYKNRFIQEDQCYRCHVDYWVFGTLKAKLAGLKHLYHWVTDAPVSRGVKQLRLRGPYDNHLCLRCHAGSQTFLASNDGIHRSLAEELVEEDPDTGEPRKSCLDCHGPSHATLADYKAGHKEAQ